MGTNQITSNQIKSREKKSQINSNHEKRDLKSNHGTFERPQIKSNREAQNLTNKFNRDINNLTEQIDISKLNPKMYVKLLIYRHNASYICIKLLVYVKAS